MYIFVAGDIPYQSGAFDSYGDPLAMPQETR
jgi:hypothetical protein